MSEKQEYVSIITLPNEMTVVPQLQSLIVSSSPRKKDGQMTFHVLRAAVKAENPICFLF